MSLEDACEVGLLFITKIKTDLFQRCAFQNSPMSFTHPVHLQPLGKRALIMLAKVPLESAEADAA